MTSNAVSLYIHIPFCIKKCVYCAFTSLPAAGEEIKQAYFEALCAQINAFPCDKTIRTVYFGGGTPPVIGTRRLAAICGLIAKRFSLAEGCEITVEVNPKSIAAQGLRELRSAGFNRLSVGVQSANDDILAKLGRVHDFADAREGIEQARNAGFANISADMIFALPWGREYFADSLAGIVSLGTEHISAYSLQVEPGTPLYGLRKQISFPTEEAEEAEYSLICRELAEHGYEHYEISSFAKPGFASRHNMNYWRGGEYFGFGAAAHSFYLGRRFSCTADVRDYIRKAPAGLFAATDFDSESVLTPDERAEEHIMLMLRTSDGAYIPQSAYPAAKRIAALGYGDFSDGKLVLNEKGFRVSNEIIAEILA